MSYPRTGGNDSPGLARRDFLRSYGFLAATFIPLLTLQRLRPPPRTSIPQDFEPANPRDAGSVKNYASQIMDAAYRIRQKAIDIDEGDMGLGIGLILGSACVLKSPRRDALRDLMVASGGSALIYRVLDRYSTWRCATTMQDPRFREYGLDRCFAEENPLLPAHPTPCDVVNPKELGIDAALVIAGTVSLPIGFGLGARTTNVFYHNMFTNGQILLCYQLGDRVKGMLGQRAQDGLILRYLSNVSLIDVKG